MIVAQPPQLSLTRFRLRQLRRTDVGQWFSYLTEPRVFEHTSWAVKTQTELLSLIDNYESDKSESPIRLAIVDADSDRLAGTVGFHAISKLNRVAEIVYDLDSAYWGRGLGTESCRTLTGWGFENLELNRIQATTLKSNQRSERVLQKCGFEFEGLLRGYRMVRGAPGDFKMYAKLCPS